mgnify:CR=1 FL=1
MMMTSDDDDDDNDDDDDDDSMKRGPCSDSSWRMTSQSFAEKHNTCGSSGLRKRSTPFDT